MADAWAAAGEYGKMTDIWGGGAEGQKQWEYMAQVASKGGFGLGDLSAAITKLVNNTHSGNADTLSMLK